MVNVNAGLVVALVAKIPAFWNLFFCQRPQESVEKKRFSFVRHASIAVMFVAAPIKTAIGVNFCFAYDLVQQVSEYAILFWGSVRPVINRFQASPHDGCGYRA